MLVWHYENKNCKQKKYIKIYMYLLKSRKRFLLKVSMPKFFDSPFAIFNRCRYFNISITRNIHSLQFSILFVIRLYIKKKILILNQLKYTAMFKAILYMFLMVYILFFMEHCINHFSWKRSYDTIVRKQFWLMGFIRYLIFMKLFFWSYRSTHYLMKWSVLSLGISKLFGKSYNNIDSI